MNLIKSLEKMAEREKASLQEIITIVSIAIETTYKNYLKEKNKEFGEIKIEFNGENFIIFEKEGLSFNLKSLESNKNFSYNCSKEIDRLIKIFRKDKEYEYFYPLKNQIVGGSVQSINENGRRFIINLGNGLGYWERTKSESFSREKINLGRFLRFLILDVKKDENLTKVIISRNEEEFIEKIFEIEIPEIKNQLIKIEKVIRIPELVSKVVLKLNRNQEKIDLIGSCIGKDKTRIKSLLKELGKERIDLVLWNKDKKKILMNLLSPVEIVSIVEKDQFAWEVIIPEFRMSLVLQGSGKVMQKIEDYLEIKLKIRSFESTKDQDEIIVWNGNIEFDDYETNKILISREFQIKKREKFKN